MCEFLNIYLVGSFRKKKEKKIVDLVEQLQGKMIVVFTLNFKSRWTKIKVDQSKMSILLWLF